MKNKIPRILIADDDPSLLRTMSDVLKMKGYQPVSAQTGGAALAHIEEYDFDVALIDLRLGDVSGLDVLSGIKARAPETECILLTGHATQDSAIKAMQMDAFGYFQKPLNMEQVLLSIQRAVEKHQSARALRASEERYRTLFQKANEGIFYLSTDFKILALNESFARMHGYSVEEMLGMNLQSLDTPETARLATERIPRILAGESLQFEVEHYHKDGHVFPLAVSTSLVFVGSESIIQAFHHDITERRQAEEALRASEGKSNAILNAIPDLMFRINRDGVYLDFRAPKGSELYTPPELIVGRSLHETLPPDVTELALKNLHAALESGEVQMFEYALPVASGPHCYEARMAKSGADEAVIIVRDITERKRAENKLRSRERFLALLNNMTRAIITAQNFEELANVLTNDITTLLEADSCYITRWDPVKEQVFPVATNAQLDQPYSTIVFEKGQKNLTTSALEAGKIIVAEDHENSPYTSREIAQKFPTKSAIGIPLIYGEHRLGAAIIGFNEYHQFTQEELDHAEQAGNQIALALWNTQQDIELQRSLREEKTLADIALALSETEHIGLTHVLHLIVNSAKNLIANAEQSVIHLFNEKEQTLTSEAVAGFSDPVGGKKAIRLGEGIAGQVIKSGETINIADINTDPRFLKLGDTIPIYRSLMVAPVHSGKLNLGTISIQSNIPYAFTPNDNKLLSQLGTQAAIAIENANLLEKTKQALKEANALYRVNKGLIASLEPDDLLQDTVELLRKNFDYYYVQIFVADPDTGNFIMRAGSGKVGAQLKAEGHQLALGEGIVGYAAETGAAFFTNNVEDAVSFVRHPLLPDIKSELAAPVKIGNEILGVLDIQQSPPRTLSQRDIQLVSGVADQLAIALQRADLYENLQVSLQQEKAIRSQMMQNERLTVMGRLLATVSHELNNPLQAIQNALFLLKEEQGISSQGRQDLEIVLAESERMANLIERLRATYRPTQSEDFLPTQINDIVEDVHALISTHLRHNQIAFEFQPDPELPYIPALSDQIRQVTLNLFMNACEAMTPLDGVTDGGRLSVSTQLQKESGEVMLAVSDTGSGIPPEMLPAIFEAFVTNKHSGTGLGLTISHDIVMKHRGRITAENNADRGATFKVWLPINNGEIE